MKLFQIWCEADLDRDMTACHLGQGKGVNLFEACLDLCTKNQYFADFFVPFNMSYKGCKLFDSEDAARVKEDEFYAS